MEGFNNDFLDTPVKTVFTYKDISEPWKKINQLKFLLGMSIMANLICLIMNIIK